jgi:hypothetical protein
MAGLRLPGMLTPSDLLKPIHMRPGTLDQTKKLFGAAPRVSPELQPQSSVVDQPN